MLDRNQFDMKRIPQQCRPVNHSGCQSAVACRDADALDARKARILLNLPGNLHRSLHIAQRSARRGGTVFNDIRFFPLLLQLYPQLLDKVCPFLLAGFSHIVFLCAQKMVEQGIPLQLLWRWAIVYQHTAQSQTTAGSRTQRTEVRLGLTGRQNGFLALCQRISQQILQIAYLVASHAQPVEIVPLDKQRTAA